MRSYGLTNAAPWASAPPLGPAGDTYFNTTNKSLYVSDGIAWKAFPPVYNAISDVTSQRPNPREGEMVYIMLEDAFRFWDGANWVPVNTPDYNIYSWKTDTTASDPGTGGIKANNADPSLATVLYIEVVSRARVFPMGLLSLAIGDTIGVYWMTALTSWGLYAVTGAPVMDGSGNWLTVPVTIRSTGSSGFGAMPNNDAVAVVVTTGGDKVSTASTPPETVKMTVTQTNHGFAKLVCVRLSGTTWVRALADTVANADVVGVVSNVINANTFEVTFAGRIVGGGGPPGGWNGPRWLSDVQVGGQSGILMSAAPTTPGHVDKPVLYCDEPDSIVQIQRGSLIPDPNTKDPKYPWGRIGYAVNATDGQTGISTVVDLTSLFVSFTADPSRLIRASGYAQVQGITGATRPIGYVRDGSNAVLEQDIYHLAAANQFAIIKPVWIGSLSGAQTLKMSAYTNTNTINVVVAAANPSWFLVEDIGPA